VLSNATTLLTFNKSLACGLLGYILGGVVFVLCYYCIRPKTCGYLPNLLRPAEVGSFGGKRQELGDTITGLSKSYITIALQHKPALCLKMVTQKSY